MSSSLVSAIFYSVFSLFGISEPPTSPPVYDAIVVGAGAGGCPLAQTLVEGGLNVLLVERGSGTRPKSSEFIYDTWHAIRSDCAEVIRSVDGISIISGNCLGGATSFNLGMYVEETPEWVVDHLGKGFGTKDEIADAFEWVRDRIGAAPTHEDIGSGADKYIRASLQTFMDPGNFEAGNVSSSGSPRLQPGKVWRTYSIFDPITGERNSVDRILDLDNEKLEIRSNTKVVKILFDGDSDVPTVPSQIKTGTPRARCVKFESGEIQCVREGGRIYLAAGAVHTVELLLKSGIKRGGKVDNSQVGENFSDKPLLALAGNFAPSFDESGDVTFGHLAATKTVTTSRNETKLLLVEEFSYGIPGILSLVGAWRNNLPKSARNRLSADVLFGLIDLCEANIENPGDTFFLCEQFQSQTDHGCDTTTGVTVVVATPTSKGRVYLNSDGDVQVDGGFLTTEDDMEALGLGVRSAWAQLQARKGVAAMQRPCADPDNITCTANSCPDILAGLIDTSRDILSVLDPSVVQNMPLAPASMVSPHYIEHYLKSSTDNLVVGEKLSEWIVSGYHYVGTASVGAVVDENLKVMGAEGLYVADASVIPQTPRVNSMALVLLVGHRAGLKFLQERHASV